MANVDSDGDSMNNYAEYRAGTDPNDQTSRLQLVISRRAGGAAELMWNSVARRTYSMLTASDSSGTFELEMAGITATPPFNSYTNITLTNVWSRFYRLRVD